MNTVKVRFVVLVFGAARVLTIDGTLVTALLQVCQAIVNGTSPPLFGITSGSSRFVISVGIRSLVLGGSVLLEIRTSIRTDVASSKHTFCDLPVASA